MLEFQEVPLQLRVSSVKVAFSVDECLSVFFIAFPEVPLHN